MARDRIPKTPTKPRPIQRDLVRWTIDRDMVAYLGFFEVIPKMADVPTQRIFDAVARHVGPFVTGKL